LSFSLSGSRRAGRLAVATVLTVAIGGLLSACGSSSSSSTASSNAAASKSASASGSGAASGSPYRVLYICPLSGQLAAAGAAELSGLKAAAAAVNAQGGVLGHKVTITTMDDAGTGTKAVAAAQQALASGAQYNLIFGGCFGQDGIPVSAAFAKTPAIQISPLPDNLIKSGKYPYVFLAGSLTSAPEVAMATEMKSKGITKFAIVTGDDATGQPGAQELQAAAKSLGMNVTSTQFVPDTAVDATSQVQAAIGSHPQAIAVNNFTPTIGPILKARTKLGSTLPLYGDAYFSALNLAAVSTTQDRTGVTSQAFPFLVHGTPAEKTPSWVAFQKFDAKFNPKPLLSLYADMTTWDGLMEARAAAIKAGTISGAAVPQALAGITTASDVQGFLGGKALNSPSYHAWALTPEDYFYAPAGISKAGIIYPGT
jgi:branched-chain amino acid transport system substrate-binding protein